MESMEKQKSLPEHLVELLNGGHAHVDFDGAVKNWPANLQGMRPEGAAHSPWEVLSTCALPNGTSWNSPVIPGMSPQNFPLGIGRRRKLRPTAKPGAKARMHFAPT